MDTSTKTILLVEDEPDVMRIIAFHLSNVGYRVVQAMGAEDAYRKLEKFKDRIDAIVTDLAMPRVSGVSLIDCVRRDPDYENLPIIAVTAFTWDPLGRSAADLGCDAFVNKPVDRAVLVKTVQDVIARRAAAASGSK